MEIENWVPNIFSELKDSYKNGDFIILASLNNPWEKESLLEFNTFLSPKETQEIALNSQGSIDHNSDLRNEYDNELKISKLSFGIGGGGPQYREVFEPLVVSWESGIHKILFPSQELLGFFNLVPNFDKENEIYSWDDLSRPEFNVITSKPFSTYSYSLLQSSYVKIKIDYLQEYLTERNLIAFQTFYSYRKGGIDKESKQKLNGEYSIEFKTNNSLIDITKLKEDENKAIFQIWGTQKILGPKNSPVSDSRWDYGNLQWPEIEKPLDRNSVLKLTPSDFVFLDDKVLAKFESDPSKYDINPLSGSVSYSSVWNIHYCKRVGRDKIKAELKKLYEGVPAEITKHYNSYAVSPPTEDECKKENIAIMSNALVMYFYSLGEKFSIIYKLLDGTVALTVEDFCGLNPQQIKAWNWWKDSEIYPLTFHVPKELSEEGFLHRSVQLNKFLIENMKERNFRKILKLLGGDKEEFGSIKLLDRIIQLAIISKDTGLNFKQNSSELVNRLNQKTDELKKGEHLPSPIQSLFLLSNLRLLGSHKESSEKNIIYKSNNIDPSNNTEGWGFQLDKLYQNLILSLIDSIKILDFIINDLSIN